MHPESKQLQTMLELLYLRHQGEVGFVDESYSTGDSGDRTFYTVTANLVQSADLDSIRSDFLVFAIEGRWHTTEMNANRQSLRIHDFIDYLASNTRGLVVAIQTEMLNRDFELARRECLIQLVSQLSGMGCRLVIYERREDTKTRNSDAALFTRAKRDGFIPRDVKIFAGTPSAEPLLWAPDLAGWALRRYLAIQDSKWILPLLPRVQIIDASTETPLTQKGSKPAAAMGSDPGFAVDLKDEVRNRSSNSSIAPSPNQEKGFLIPVQNIIEPVHDPKSLREWLRREFPK